MWQSQLQTQRETKKKRQQERCPISGSLLKRRTGEREKKKERSLVEWREKKGGGVNTKKGRENKRKQISKTNTKTNVIRNNNVMMVWRQ